jgi:hypothetical protein
MQSFLFVKYFIQNSKGKLRVTKILRMCLLKCTTTARQYGEVVLPDASTATVPEL